MNEESVQPGWVHVGSARHEPPTDIIGITASQPRLIMADIVLRNLDEDLKERLRRAAAAHRRSMNAELRDIVRRALDGTPPVDATGLRQLAAEIRALSQGRAQTPSETLLREGRDER
jgi:antitoxin FitA